LTATIDKTLFYELEDRISRLFYSTIDLVLVSFLAFQNDRIDSISITPVRAVWVMTSNETVEKVLFWHFSNFSYNKIRHLEVSKSPI